MKLVPYLNFYGQCEEAMNFYKDVLGGEVLGIHRFGDSPMSVDENMKSKIMHMGIKFGDNILYASDGMESKPVEGNRYTLSINIDSPSEAEKVFSKLSEGGNITMPIQATFWAERFGMFKDKYGVTWMINCEKPRG
jgi:PhnB protein